jgi:hypothetical protein
MLTRTPPSFKRAGSNPPSKAIDREVFDQILEFDEDDEGFSELMVNEYFVQAEKTFSDMETALCAFTATLSSSAP